MPRFYPNTQISDCWSSVGQISFYHRDGLCYFRSKPYSRFAGTAEQTENLDLHRRALAAWRSLGHSEQLLWRDYALNVESHRPPFDRTSHISGYNLFVSAYHGFAQLGDEHIPVPAPFVPFPIFSADFIGCEIVNETDLKLRFKITLCSTEAASRYRILGKIQLTSPGYGRNPGNMRNYLSPSVPQGRQSEIEFIVPDFNVVSGLESDAYQIHIRYLLVDSETGYRSQYHCLSTLAVPE